MNVRLANALFLDEWMHERPFDPEFNTDAVIQALDFYKNHGVLMINVSLQGAQAGYDKSVNGIDRENAYRLGPGRGAYVSAFRPDGSLKPDWLARLERLLRAADQRGMFVNLMYFYHGQSGQFRSTAAIHNAAVNITDWLIAHNFRNIIVDVANEYDLPGPQWEFKGYIPQNIIPLIDDVRERFRHAGYVLPIGTSSDGRMRYPASLQGQVDVLLFMATAATREEKVRRVAELKEAAAPRPDDRGRQRPRHHGGAPGGRSGKLRHLLPPGRRLGIPALDPGAAISLPLPARHAGGSARRHARKRARHGLFPRRAGSHRIADAAPPAQGGGR